MTLEKKLWGLVSEYVRRKENGICFTCGMRYWNEELGENDWKSMHAGHFRHGALDFDLMNIHCQCPPCNIDLGGNLKEYEFQMLQEYGTKAVNDLIKRSREVFIASDQWLLSKIEEMKNLLSQL